MNLSININEQNIYKSSGISESILGEVSIKIGDIFFPEETWNDFVVIILGWWLKDVFSLLNNKKQEVKCYFMDGPYRFIIKFDKKRLFSISFIKEWSDSIECIAKINCEKELFISELLLKSDLVIDICKRNQWVSKDLEILKKYYSKLKNKFK
jgi:hypothetical protein